MNKIKCEFCPYYWQEVRIEWTSENEYKEIPLEPRPSCHFNPDEMLGIPAPCEE